MKFSRYNYLFYSETLNVFLLFNSASELFMEISEEMYAFLNKLKAMKHFSNTDLNSLDLKYKKTFIDKCVFVDNDEDIIYKYKFGVLQRRYDRTSVLNLTIAPTRDCNFRCVYCYENERPSIYMSECVQNALIRFVHERKPQKLNVCWYGGEPTLAYDIIKSLTNRFIDEVGSENYSSIIVTNGFLLDQNICSQLNSLRIKHIQVTLDGDKETHDRRRPHISGVSSYDTIINNLRNLTKALPLLPVSIRVNVDKGNAKDFIKVYNEIKNINKNYVVYIGFVKNETCSKDCISYNPEKIDIYKELFYNNGVFLPNFRMANKGIDCMARKINSYLVDPMGNLFKCWMDIGNKDKIIGNILDNGYHTNITMLARYMQKADNLNNQSCNNCKAFLICDGGCPKDRINNEINTNNKVDTCSIYKNNIKDMLEITYSAVKSGMV